MKKGFCDITIVLDRSGSMDSVKDDTIGGFNQFLRDQKDLPGEAALTLVQFDDKYEIVYKDLPIKDAMMLTDHTFVPRGSTALLDAIGKTINDKGKKFAEMHEDQRPEKVVFVILTDGEENSSMKFTSHEIGGMIQHQRDQYQWEFVFLGANQDAIATASSLHIPQNTSMTYAANHAGVTSAYTSLCASLGSYRAGTTSGVTFSEDDRAKQREAGA